MLIEEVHIPEISASPLDRVRYLLHVSRKPQSAFAKLLNIDPSTLSKTLAGKLPVTEAFINRVVVNLNVSKEWLAHGVGVPFERQGKDSGRDMHQGAPVYDIDVTAGCVPLSHMFTNASILGYIDLPNMNANCPVVKVTGNSMHPDIPDGAFIAIRPVRNTSIISWGSTYVVELEDYRMVKVLRRCREDNSKVILHSFNPDFDDIEVKREEILRMFVVEAILNYKLL